MKRVYLDYNATTPVDPEAVKGTEPSFTGFFGNPSSIHFEGRRTKKVLDDSRQKIASFLNASPSEIVFTASGSEANNLAIKGVAEASKDLSKYIVTSSVEHPSVSKVTDYLEEKSWKIVRLPVDRQGMISLSALEGALDDGASIVSLMLANNETGVVFPVAEAAAMAKARGAIFHTDAVQAAGKMPLDVKALGVDLLSLSGHKFYAPKGIGVLYVREGTKLAPLIHGGGQESGLRAGTENIDSIVAMAAAAEISMSGLEEETGRISALKAKLAENLGKNIDGVVFNAPNSPSLPNTLSVSFPGLSSESLLISLDLEGFSVSAGSACSSGALSGSPVLKAMGLEKTIIEGTLRVSLGRWTTEEDIDAFSDSLVKIVKRMKML